MLPAAYYAAQTQTDHSQAMAAAISALAGGLGSLLVNQISTSLTESKNTEIAERNHLVRRGMARALHHALEHGKEELELILPPDLRSEFIERWLHLLKRAADDDSVLDTVLPLSLSEQQWQILDRYIGHDPQRPTVRGSDAVERIKKENEEDSRDLAALLSEFPVEPDDDGPIRIFAETLAQRWSLANARSFAELLLPYYRNAFACRFSAGGPESNAIQYKGMQWTHRQLEEIQISLVAECRRLEEHVTKEHMQTRAYVGAEFDSLRSWLLGISLEHRFDGSHKLEDPPSKEAIEAGLARYRDWFANNFKLPKFLSEDLDAEQTVLDLPELSASIPKKAFDPPSKISRTPDQSQGDKPEPPPRDASLGMKVADIFAMVTTGHACGYDFATPGYAFIGEAGLGKSSLLRRLAIESLEKNYLPILIDWTSWYGAVKDEKYQRDKNLVKYIRDGQWLPDELRDITNPFLYAAAAGYGVILILDGWDEVGDDKLKAAELRNLLGQYKRQITIVIATRPENYDSLENTLVPVELGRISTEDCIVYLQRYVPAARSDASLENAIISSPYIGNGLLLTLVALSGKEQQDTFNLKNQAAIFEDYFASPSSRFLDSIKREKPQNKKGLLLLFQLLAYHATATYDSKTYECGRPVFPQDWVYKCSYYLAETHQQFKGLDAEEIARFAIKSSGILAILGNNVRFSHASLQDYYCGRAIAEYEREQSEIDTLSNKTASATGNFNSPAIDGVVLRNGINRIYQPSCFESGVWLHRIRSLRGIVGPFVERWISWIDRPLDFWLLMDIEWMLKIIERVGDVAYVPFLNSALDTWRDPSKFDQSTAMKLYPYNAIAQLCVLNSWDDVSTRLLKEMSSDDIQLLLSGIAGPVKKAFPRSQACQQHLQASLIELLAQSDKQPDERKYRLLEVAAFLEDYMERALFEPVGIWADHVEKLIIKRDPEILRLFAVAARSNRFSAKLALVANQLLEIYMQNGISLTHEEGRYAPEALAGCVCCLAAHNDQLVGEIDEDKLELLVTRLKKLRESLNADQFREFLAEFARTVPFSQVEGILKMLTNVHFQDGVAIPDEWFELLSHHEQTAWVLI